MSLYKGYARFYDLDNKRFVGDLRAENFNASCGRLLRLEGRTVTIYDENGEAVAENLLAGNGFLIRNRRPYEVYDENLELLVTSDSSLLIFNSTSVYIDMLTDDVIQIIDNNGKRVLESTFKRVLLFTLSATTVNMC